jgi:hypothetical protein
MNMDNEMIEFLKSIGAIEDAGDGNYRLTDAASEFVPEVVKSHESQFNNDVFSLWMNGMLELVFDEDGDPMIDLSEDSKNEDLKKERLTKQEASTLEMILFQYEKTVDKRK